jgi:DNA-binding HxlR family transcriptional regulator
MAADGIVHRKVFHEVPPRVEYSVTEFGADTALIPLANWSKQHADRTEAKRAGSENAAATDI